MFLHSNAIIILLENGFKTKILLFIASIHVNRNRTEENEATSSKIWLIRGTDLKQKYD